MPADEAGPRPDPPIGVLISGRGSNLQALIEAIADGRLDARIAVVISNRAEAAGLERARRGGHRDAGPGPSRVSRRATTSTARWPSELRARGVALVCLAGFMRLDRRRRCSRRFPNAILNIHPSLLPAFPGVDAQRQALEHGVKVTGATVHLVTGELDGGPIVLQAASRSATTTPWRRCRRGSSPKSIASIRKPCASCSAAAGASPADASAEPWKTAERSGVRSYELGARSQELGARS